MSHFLVYAARLQDAGIDHLSVTLWTRKDRVRMMRVRPHGSYGTAAHERWPSRDFELCGTDRVLESLQDDLAYAEGGPTAEAVQAAVDANPLLRDDLTAWYADWLMYRKAEEEDLAAADTEISDDLATRSAEYVRGLLRGVRINRESESRRAAAPAGGGAR